MISVRQWKAAVSPLLGQPEEWTFKGKLTYRSPVGWTLRGVLGEGSGFNRDQVYVWTLHMPLLVPEDHLNLSHGQRIQSGSSTFGLSTLQEAVSAALRDVKTESDALRNIAGSENEEAPYAWLLLGEDRRAERLLARPYASGDERPFVRDARHRLATVAELLRNEGREAAVSHLREWRDKTCAALGIDDNGGGSGG
jgi:hypothetical protein